MPLDDAEVRQELLEQDVIPSEAAPSGVLQGDAWRVRENARQAAMQDVMNAAQYQPEWNISQVMWFIVYPCYAVLHLIACSALTVIAYDQKWKCSDFLNIWVWLQTWRVCTSCVYQFRMAQLDYMSRGIRSEQFVLLLRGQRLVSVGEGCALCRVGHSLVLWGAYWLFFVGDKGGKTCAPEIWWFAFTLWALNAAQLILPFAFCLLVCLCLPCLIFVWARIRPRNPNQEATSEEVISRMPRMGVGQVRSGRRPSASSSLQCSICLADYGPDDELIMLTCPGRHHFHSSCCEAWLRVSQCCPICRTNLTTQEVEMEEGRGEGGEGGEMGE